MTRKLLSAVGALFLLGGSTACSDTCDDMCEHIASCDPDLLIAIPEGVSCKWDDDQDAVEEECVKACEDAWEGMADAEADEVENCLECVQEDLGESCRSSDWADAVDDQCRSECDGDDVGDFWEDFGEEWNPDLDC